MLINKNNWYWWAGGATAAIAMAAMASKTETGTTVINKVSEGAAKATEVVKNVISKAMNKKDFVKTYYPMAKEAEKVTGLNALVALTTAAIESAWGKSAPFFNFFGHKKGKADLPFYESKTWEFGTTPDPTKSRVFDRLIKVYAPGEKVNEPGSIRHNTVMSKTKYAYRVYGKFRKYNSIEEAFIGHGEFLKNNKRYAPAFSTGNDKDFAAAIHKAGYATDANYTNKLHTMIDDFKTLIA